ncbi:hypothetical protein ACOSP7_018890 [Xanthoceras sorbifolium]
MNQENNKNKEEKKTAAATNIGGEATRYKVEEEEDNDDENENDGEDHKDGGELPLMAVNHMSRLCRNVKESIDFYTKVLGFVLIERPPAFDFEGAWLFNYGVGIHLIQSQQHEDNSSPDTDHLDPMDNHISFQSEDMEARVKRLEEMDVKYMKRTVEDKENGTVIDQLFFNDPDGFMIEICNCENLKLVPAGSLGKIKLPADRHNPPVDLKNNGGDDDA